MTRKYRPPRLSEDESFMGEVCYNCAKDISTCEIYLSSNIYNVKNAGYPEEWQYDIFNQPMCTAFEEGD